MLLEKVTPHTGPVVEADDSDRAPRVTLKWIAGPRMDLLWFIGGALCGYGMFVLFLLHATLGWNMLTVWLVWYVLLDIPHFFGTYMRTYLDREEMRRRPVLLWGSLGWLGVGPLVLLVAYAMHQSGSAALQRRYTLPFDILLAFINLWAYWHVVRQHYGIMSLYKRKNNDMALVDYRVDQALLYVGLVAPFVALVLRHGESRWVLGMPAGGPQPWGWDYIMVVFTIVLVVLAVTAFVWRQVQRWRQDEPLNMAKILFLLAVVPLHVFLCYHPVVLTTSLLVFSAFVTIYHDVQYHAIVWHTQRTRFRQPGAGFARFGLAALVGKHFLIYFACAVALGIGTWLLSCVLGLQSIGCLGLSPRWDTPLLGVFTVQDFLTAVAVGFIMHHYFVDQFIWRPSKDPNLRQQLQIAPATAAAT
jgi:hypothetical protein